MSQSTSDTTEVAIAGGHEDYPLTRVPESARYSWVQVAFQRLGQLSALAQFFLAASIGIGMRFWDAMLAILLGSVLLEIVTIFTGIAGQKEGLSTSVLARWTGFGLGGSALVGIAFTISLTGWFAFQNMVFGGGMGTITGLPAWLWCVVGGLVVTWIVVKGFGFMGWVAYVTVPAFVLLCLFSVYQVLKDHSLGALMASDPPSTPISFAMATTFVAGGFIVGAIFTPDMSRFNRTPMDVVKQTVVGVTLGEFFVGAIAVLLAHAVKGVADNPGLVIAIIQSTSGPLGVLILCISIVKINDWNLYPSTLGLTNALYGLTGRRINRIPVTLVLGVIGTLLSAWLVVQPNTTQTFTDFLGKVGVAFPPIAAIMIADYFILKSWRRELTESQADGDRLPREVPMWVPAGLIAWVVGWAFGEFPALIPSFLMPLHVPAITSLVVAFVVYLILGKVGMARGVGMRENRVG